MKTVFLSILILFTIVPALPFADPIANVAALIRQGNIHALSELFADSVEVSILGTENVYSKVQTELILEKFFNQNPPKSVKVIHSVNSSPNYRFGVLMVKTDNGLYRVTFTLKQIDGALALIDFRVENEKVR